MNTIRMIAVALPMMLLIACGGGGGGGTAAAPTTMPPTNMPDMPGPVTLPGYAITDLMAARTAVGGTEPTTNMTEMEIVSAIQTRATASDYFVSIQVGDDSHSAMVPDAGMLTFSRDDIEDLSLVDDTGLMGFLSNTELVMEEGGATIIQSQSAAGRDDTRFSFQTYGGWLNDLDNAVFGVVYLDVLESGETTSRFASFSFGAKSDSRPTGPSVVWRGVMVGVTETGDVLQGDLSAQYLIASSGGADDRLDEVTFDNVKNLSAGTDFSFGIFNRLQFASIPLEMDGTFGNDEIKGNFYGDDHAQIGGVFNSNTHNIVGAFGGVKQ